MTDTSRPSASGSGSVRVNHEMTPVTAVWFLILLASAIPIVMTVWAASIYVARLVW